MVRRTAATLWFAVDILVLNRRFRCENDGSEEWYALEEWLRHQLAERQEMKARLQDTSFASSSNRPCRRRPRQTAATLGRAKARGRHHDSPEINLPTIPAQLSRPKSKSKGRRCKDSRPAAAALHCYPRHHHEKFEPSKSQRFMDRDYMQQMERRLVEQHEEAIQKRIKKRQAEEAQRERQMIQAGLIAAEPPKLPALARDSWRGAASRTSDAASTAGRSHRTPKTSARHPGSPSPQPTQPQPQAPPETQQRQQQECASGETPLPDEADGLDEACPSEPPPRRSVRRPRLAILLQACKAVVGAGHHLNGSVDAVKSEAQHQQQQPQPKEQQTPEPERQHAKYESPLIAKLRQVESVEELYRLAEQIVAQTKQ